MRRNSSGVADATMRPDLEKNDAGGEAAGFAQIVGDEDDRLAEPARDVAEFALHFGARDGVESAEGLVHQQNRRISGECTGHADALALAAGELIRAAGRRIALVRGLRVPGARARDS